MNYRLDTILGAHKHRIVFTHNDLHYSNIMVNNGHISAIIDWSDSGWYPEYWEFNSAAVDMTMRKDWNAILDDAIGFKPCEYLMDQLLRGVLFS
jgi:thiamine kinase-like enzyme